MTTRENFITRLRLEVRGAVQGVGFRPFVYRLANEFGLAGSVLNTPDGVLIEVEGDWGVLDEFAKRLYTHKPEAAVIDSVEASRLAPAGYTDFRILASEARREKTATVTPDLATCPACREEIFDPRNRRFGYAFTNCTNCGPRYTIVRDIPYDRPNTTMAGFRMCELCQSEYDDPGDRRFDAQPNACPRCGPRLQLFDAFGEPVAGDPIEQTVRLLARGRIVALKGVGGFQLLVDARNGEAVRRLRALKHRDEKPFAVMFPSVEEVEDCCEVGAEERGLLMSPAAPIVLLRARKSCDLAPEVSMTSPYVGAMIPYSPLHHLLLRRLGFPVIATSGNRSEEPIAIDNTEALERLRGTADAFLLHDRPIERPADDSVAFITRRGAAVLRRARGYAPLPITMRRLMPKVLAVGAHLKNTVAIAVGRQIFISQQVGDLETVEACAAFRRANDDLCRLYEFEPQAVACDLHPDYYSTRYAETLGLPVVRIQHHHAHLASCAAENEIEEPYLGVAWDGTGYGLDHTVWGGEFFAARGKGFERVAHFRPFRLPGGEKAVRDGRRCAFSFLSETFAGMPPLNTGLDELECQAFSRMLENGLNAPVTTSAGRLFDAVAALAGVARRSTYEGQAALALEAVIDAGCEETYPSPLTESGSALELDWRPLIEEVVRDVRRKVSPGGIAAKFHNALVEWIVKTACRIGLGRVALSGGVFQNRYLLERACDRLEAKGFEVFTHRNIPPNDGGIAVGQAVLAARLLQVEPAAQEVERCV